MSDEEVADVLWRPDADALTRTQVAASQVARFVDWLGEHRGLRFDGYRAVHRWSIEHLADFWTSVWEFFGLRGGEPPIGAVLADEVMPGAQWFPETMINFAEEALRDVSGGAETALIVLDESLEPVSISRKQLRRDVAAVAETLRTAGVRPGQVVAAYLPNRYEAVVALLATASVGAVWTACSPDFGSASVQSRFAQTEPGVLIAADGYRYGGKSFARKETVADLLAQLPSVHTLITVGVLEETWTLADHDQLAQIPWQTAIEPDCEAAYEQVKFGDPLWILWSSGTTGQPKGIVQSHGGITIEFAKAVGLGSDIRAGDRYFFVTSTSWMVWNYLIGGLQLGATLVLYDGSPTFPDVDAVWRITELVGATVVGLGAGYLSAGHRAHPDGSAADLPCSRYDLSSLRTLLQTGSTLPTASWRWVYEAISPTVWYSSICGGTDVCSVLAGGTPLLPVVAGRIPAAYLGVDLRAFDEQGHELIGQEGELVVTRPLPSMPIGLLGDVDHARYRDTYFDVYPGIWRHGDWVTVEPDGSVIVSGRSDATLNRQGIRMGSADLSAVVEAIDGVADSLVIGVEKADGGYFIPLFVVPEPGRVVDDQLRDKINFELRRQLTPRHVPDKIIEIAAVPRTLTGKKLEVPVKKILRGADPDTVSGAGAVTHPEVLRWLADYAADEPDLR